MANAPKEPWTLTNITGGMWIVIFLRADMKQIIIRDR